MSNGRASARHRGGPRAQPFDPFAVTALRDAGNRVVASIRRAGVWILESACLKSEIIGAAVDVMCDGAM
jgi:hypothetical protein